MFTEEQVRELEDKLINMLAPAYTMLTFKRDLGKIEDKDITFVLKSIDRVVKWIRSQRPVEKQFRKNRHRGK
jgi:hypothetical protein